jgi:hypothetical protein
VAEAEWTVDTTIKPVTGLGRLLRHHPDVVAQLAQIAAEIAEKAGAGHKAGRYGIIVQNRKDTKRARALVHPTDSGGIHLELTQHLMLKAAASYGSHKPVTAKASGAAIAMGNKPDDTAASIGDGGAIQPIGVIR